MVFHFRCFSIGDVQEAPSTDRFYTPKQNFDPSPKLHRVRKAPSTDKFYSPKQNFDPSPELHRVQKAPSTDKFYTPKQYLDPCPQLIREENILIPILNVRSESPMVFTLDDLKKATKNFDLSTDVQKIDVQDAPSDDHEFYSSMSDFDPSPQVNEKEDIPIPNPILNMRSESLIVFTLDDLKNATKNFDLSTKIGEGGFWSVHLGIFKMSEPPFNDIHVAVKRGKKGPKGRRQWETEANVVWEIKHPNLVKLIGYCHEDYGNEGNWHMVYEYIPNGSLDYHLSGNSNKHLSWSTRLDIARDAVIALQYLHEGMGEGRQVIFRDFKPSNVLLDDNWNAKLSDFGFVNDDPQDGRTHVSTSAVGTKGYAAPEYVRTGSLTFKIDVWSYGIFLEALMTGQLPHAQNNPENDPKCMRWSCCYAGERKSKPTVDPRLEGNYSERSMQMVSSIAQKCLVKDPKLRPKMSEVLKMVKEAIRLEDKRHLNDGQT